MKLESLRLAKRFELLAEDPHPRPLSRKRGEESWVRKSERDWTCKLKRSSL